jgi:sporulation protein YlmC with PRC-barrel domain
MIRTSKLIALALTVAVALALPAAGIAQDRSPTSARAAKTAASPQANAADDVRMSKLIGMRIHNPAGQRLGTIKDVIFDTNTGRVHYAVLSLGGAMGIKEKLFAVPLSKLRPDEKGKFVLAVDKKQLETAPAFESGRWPNWNDASVRAPIDQRYGVQASDINARFRRASDVLKTKVRDSHGADIGKVSDMVVDVGASRVRYAVVKFDRAWNPNDKLIALPLGALSDAATTPRQEPQTQAAAPPRNPAPVLAFESPPEPTKGTASAVNPPGSVKTRPAPLDPAQGAGVRPLERPPLKTTTSYADDENLVYKGTREQLIDAPAFDTKQYPR